MFGGLRKKLNDVWSGADFWDQNENRAQRVQAARPAKTVKAPPIQAVSRQNAPQAPASIRRISQPQPQQRTTNQLIDKSYGDGVTGMFNKYVRDTFDANTEADKIRRQANTGLSETYKQEQARKTASAVNTKQGRNTLNQFASGGLAGAADFFGKAPGSAMQVQGRVSKAINSIDNPIVRTGVKLVAAPQTLFQGEKEANKQLEAGKQLSSLVENKKQQSGIGNRRDDNRLAYGAGQVTTQLPAQIATGGLGLANTGLQTTADEANRAQAKGKSNNQALGIGALQGSVSAASEKFGIDKFVPGSGTSSRLVNAGKRVLTEGGQEAQQQFTQNLIANKTYDPNQSLKEGVAESAVLGGLAGGVMSPVADFKAPKRPTTNLVSKPTRTRLRPEEARIWSDYQETLYKGNRMPAQVVNETHNKARQIADSLGVDIITGSPDEIAGRMNPLLEQSMAFQKEPTTSLVSRAKGMITPLNQGGYIQLGAPEPKKLSQDIKDQFSKQGSFGRDAMDRLEANKISKGDLERAGVIFDPKQVKKIAQTLPEFKDNPVMTYRKGDYRYMSDNGRYRSTPDVAESGTFEFKHKDGVMRLNPEALFGKEMAQKLAQTAKDGEQVDFTDTMKASGNRLFTYNQTPDSTVLNRKEPKLNSVEQKVTETEPKRTEIDKDTQMITSIAEPTAKVQKPSNIKESDNSVTVSYGSKGSVNIYRKADGTIGTTTDGLGGNAPSYTKNALELPEVKSKFAQSDPLESLKQEARKYKSAEEFVKTQGTPIFHGTDAIFDEFDLSKAGTQKYSDWGDGIYFDPRKSGADYYRREAVSKRSPEVQQAYKNYEDTLKRLGTKPMYESIDLGYGTPKYLEAEKARKAYVDSVEKAKSDPTKGRVIEAYLKNDAKIKDVYISGTPDPTIGKEAAREGYDAVRIHTGPKGDPDTFLDEVVVLNPKAVKTRQQLTNLYNQATQPPKSTRTIEKSPFQSDLEKAGFGARDEFKKIPVKKPKPTDNPLESLKQEARKYKSAEEFVKAYESKTRSEYTDRFNKSLELLPEKPRVVKKGITKRSAEVGNTISKRADAQVVENVDAGLAVMREASNKDQSLTGRWMDAVKTKNVPDQYKRYDVIDGKVKTSFVDMSPEESRTFYEKNRPLFQDGTLLYENDRIYSNTPKINKEQLTSLYNENNGIIDGNVYDNNTSRTQGVGQKTGSLQKKAGAKQTSQNTRPVQSTRLLAPQPPKTKGVAPQPTKGATPKLSTPFEQNLQTAGLAPKKPKGLVVSETKPLNGQKKQVVRTGKGVVEQRTVADQIGDALGMTQDQREPSFNAVAAAKNSSSAKRLVEALNMNDDITQAAAQAQQDGKEINFFAKKDRNGRSVGIERFDPRYHKIEAGFVTDKNGNVLGNHIKVDETGMQVNVGGDVVNMDTVLGNPQDWEGHYEMSSTMERNIYENAPTKEIADKTYKFVVANKIKNEAVLKTELHDQRQALNQRTKETLAAKPRNVKAKEYKADVFDFVEGKMNQSELVSKYGSDTAQKVNEYKVATRKMYDNLLDRANQVFEQFGEPTVMRRKDYITHINELMSKPSFAGELYGQLQNSFLGEGQTQTRGEIPGNIAGRTENFEPRKKWNRFFQQRKGGEFTKDPFKAVDAYLEPTLYNIHMTEPAVRARAVESAFRTAREIKETDTSHVTEAFDKALDKYKTGNGGGDLVAGFQEYANAVAGKTQRWDRQVVDAGAKSRLALHGWQKLQAIGGRSTVLGNVSSVLAQPLNQVGAVAEAGPINYAKGIAASIGSDKTIEQSPFITARRTDIKSMFRSRGEKIMDVGGVPLQAVEMASVEQAWNAIHQKVKSEGLTGKEAILETDRRTERTVAGRGIADKPELYRSTIANGVLQYTLEVNASNKQFWRDLSPKQKATFLVASTGANMLMGAVTGFEPLPDFLGAMIDTAKDFFDKDKEGNIAQKSLRGVQRGFGEYVSQNPIASAGANMLPQDTRKSIFGKDAQVSRFEGTAAPVQVVKNVVNAGSSLAKGQLTNARDSALKVAPFGNQAKKTITGTEMLARGYAVNAKGEKTFDAPTSPVGKGKALLFGPNSSGEARQYYDKKNGVTKSSTPSKTSGDLGEYGDVKNVLKAQFDTKEGREFLAMNAAEKKEAAKNDTGIRQMYEQYNTTKRVNKASPDRPAGLAKNYETFLNGHAKRTPEQRERLAYSQNDYDLKLAEAKYEEDKLKGKVSRAEKINRDYTIKKAQVGAKFSKDVRESYNSLSKAELTALAESDPNGQKIWDDAVAYGDALVEAGLLKKNKLKTKSKGGGKGRRKGKGRGGKGGRGGKRASKYDYTKDLFGSGGNIDSNNNTKALRAILAKAMSGKS